MTEFTEIVHQRRTIHHFKPDAVPKEFIEKALALSIYAPNHHHTHPVKYYSFGTETKAHFLEYAKTAFSDRDPQTAEKKLARWASIPGWILVTRKIADNPKTAHEDYATLSIALYIMMQSLSIDGIGSKWSTGSLLFESDVYELLNIDPEKEAIEGLFWYGYADKVPLPFPKPTLNDYVTELP